MSKRSILYVDDEPVSHILFKAVFEDDYDVHTAHSAREGLEILRRQPIQVLITDQCMPEMTGAELLEEIRDELPDIGRVMLTAYSDLEAIIQAVHAGGLDRYVTKPWEADELKQVIEEALHGYERRVGKHRRIQELEREIAREQRIRRELEKHVPEPVLEEILAASADE